ncbi:MAG: hypothetical protein CSA26_13235 [Desulfobacterales bacterium]|nr:MAG: hypothetical protein CSA26_13235 [Desulfobacterales bacterium]
MAYAASVNGFYATAGNRATLLPDAQSTKAQMIADFDAATDHIHVLYYIWLTDNTGTAIAEALMRAAKRGVTCRAMVDGLGSRRLLKSEVWQHMQDAGVELAVAMPLNNPIKTLLLSRIDLRNHRKITVIDGKITYCGSQNCADPAFRVKRKYAPWVDVMLRFEGPVVAGPTERRAATPQLFSTLISQAQETLNITTPYFVPDYSVINAICAAAYRGVSVTMIFPKRNDSWIVAATSRSYYRQLLQAGVRIYEFNGGLLHAKIITIDATISLIGSTNMDLRSFDLNYENNILFNDKSLTQAINARQQSYIDNADSSPFSPIHLICQKLAAVLFLVLYSNWTFCGAS